METDVQAVLVQELVRNIESRAERRAFYQGRTYGMNFMAQGCDPHMWDAANLAKLSWDNVSRMTIARCWVKGLREAVRRSNANATRQLLITEVFPRRSYLLIIKFGKLQLAPNLK